MQGIMDPPTLAQLSLIMRNIAEEVVFKLGQYYASSRKKPFETPSSKTVAVLMNCQSTLNEAQRNTLFDFIKLNYHIEDDTRLRRQDLLDLYQTLLTETGKREKKRDCLLYTSPSPRDQRGSRMPSSA